MAPDPVTISKTEFDDLLSQYQHLIESVSAGKPGRSSIFPYLSLDGCHGSNARAFPPVAHST